MSGSPFRVSSDIFIGCSKRTVKSICRNRFCDLADRRTLSVEQRFLIWQTDAR